MKIIRFVRFNVKNLNRRRRRRYTRGLSGPGTPGRTATAARNNKTFSFCAANKRKQSRRRRLRRFRRSSSSVFSVYLYVRKIRIYTTAFSRPPAVYSLVHGVHDIIIINRVTLLPDPGLTAAAAPGRSQDHRRTTAGFVGVFGQKRSVFRLLFRPRRPNRPRNNYYSFIRDAYIS